MNETEIKIAAVTMTSSPSLIKRERDKQTVHKCSECDFETNKKLLLKKHCLVEHADKIEPDSLINQHKCEYCGKAFKDPIQLSNHKNIHLGLKPYKCVECEQYFTTRGELIRHTRYKYF
jgi:hypothetical protein